MTLTTRRMIVLGLIGSVLLIGNILFVANWLSEKGVTDWATNIRAEYLTGTAITIIVVPPFRACISFSQIAAEVRPAVNFATGSCPTILAPLKAPL